MAQSIAVAERDSIDELRTVLQKSRDEGQKTRIRAVIAAKVGGSRSHIAALFSICERSVTNWIKAYNESGTEALRTKVGGRPKGSARWSDDIFQRLVAAIDQEGGYWSIPRMQGWLKEHAEHIVPLVTIWYRVSALGYSYKSARPVPEKGNEEMQAHFKKTALFQYSKR